MAENSQSEQLKIPPILRPLLESLARETLQNKPDDVVEFGYLYFKTFLEHRSKANCSNSVLLQDQPTYDCFRKGLSRKHRELLSNCKAANSESFYDASNSEMLEKAATKIQAAFRGHRVRVKKCSFDKTPQKEQKYGSSEQVDEIDNKKDLKRHSVGGYSYANRKTATPEDRAATKIQAQLRGYLARKNFEHKKQEENIAAAKIQAGIRGFLTRKKLKDGIPANNNE